MGWEGCLADPDQCPLKTSETSGKRKKSKDGGGQAGGASASTCHPCAYVGTAFLDSCVTYVCIWRM